MCDQKTDGEGRGGGGVKLQDQYSQPGVFDFRRCIGEAASALELHAVSLQLTRRRGSWQCRCAAKNFLPKAGRAAAHKPENVRFARVGGRGETDFGGMLLLRSVLVCVPAALLATSTLY